MRGSPFPAPPARRSWGAVLFGNPAPGATGANRLPDSVAGAFGVGYGVRNGWERRLDGDYVIGAFAAHRTGWTDAPEGVRRRPPWDD